MAYRELHVIEIKEILRLWAMGRGAHSGHRDRSDRSIVIAARDVFAALRIGAS